MGKKETNKGAEEGKGRDNYRDRMSQVGTRRD